MNSCYYIMRREYAGDFLYNLDKIKMHNILTKYYHADVERVADIWIILTGIWLPRHGKLAEHDTEWHHRLANKLEWVRAVLEAQLLVLDGEADEEQHLRRHRIVLDYI